MLLQGEELKKLIGSPVYIECSSKTQQVHTHINHISMSFLFVVVFKKLKMRGLGFCRM